MTVREYATKYAKMATDDGLLTAAGEAAREGASKTLLRPYIAHKERQVQQRAVCQQSYLDLLWQEDSYTLLVFDTGRYDLLAPLLRDLYDGDCVETYSAARDTFEWIGQVWTQQNHPDTTYISGMVPVTADRTDISNPDFQRLYGEENPGDYINQIVSVWKEDWDPALSTVTPETLVERARPHLDRDKLVVHFNQPHSPYCGVPKLLGHSNNPSAYPNQGEPNDQPLWHRVRTGKVSNTELRLAYIGSAVRALQAAKPLVEARENVIITADHGEALGEYGMYAHDRAPHPKRRSVPWMTVDGVAGEVDGPSEDRDVAAKLEALGYR